MNNRRNNACLGGYAYIILVESMSEHLSGGGQGHNVTNNIMEMTAVIEGLKDLRKSISLLKFSGLPKDYDCEVISDSKYIIDNYDEYLEIWKKNGWKKANNKPVLNKELWMGIDELTREFKSFQFQWVKGHGVDFWNNRVDQMATNFMKYGKSYSP